MGNYAKLKLARYQRGVYMTFNGYTELYLAISFWLFGMGFSVFCIMLIAITIANSFKRIEIKNYFKNNVIKSSSDTIDGKKNIYVDVTKGELKDFNTDDINALKDYFYDIFYKFENAYNNLDYNTMKMLSTSQIYNNYHTGISLDLKVGKKRVINNIQRVNVVLYEIDSTVAKQVASVMIEVSYINYTLDKNGYVISGNKEIQVNEKFDITFRKDFERKPITKCPNCGANLEGSKCSYCDSVIKDVEFKISSIKRIID